MNEEIVRAVLEFLEKTGTAIVTTGFPIAVRFVIADAIGNLVQFAVSGLLGILTLHSIKRTWKYANDNDDWGNDSPSWSAVKVILGFIILIILTVLFLSSGVFSAIKMLIAPEWYAIQNIIDIVK